jgi:hypothetical protein
MAVVVGDLPDASTSSTLAAGNQTNWPYHLISTPSQVWVTFVFHVAVLHPSRSAATTGGTCVEHLVAIANVPGYSIRKKLLQSAFGDMQSPERCQHQAIEMRRASGTFDYARLLGL